MTQRVPLATITLSVPKALARFFRAEARFREIPRDLLLAWILGEAALGVTEAGIRFDFSAPVDERPGRCTRITMALPQTTVVWIEQQAIVEDVSRNQLVAPILEAAHEVLVNRRPTSNGFGLQERRLYELEREMNAVQ